MEEKVVNDIKEIKMYSIATTIPHRFYIEIWLRKNLPDDSPLKKQLLQRAIRYKISPSNWSLEFFPGQKISGIFIKSAKLLITDIHWSGTFSGYSFGEIFLPLFERFQGNLSADIVWEDGTVERLTIINGSVIRK